MEASRNLLIRLIEHTHLIGINQKVIDSLTTILKHPVANSIPSNIWMKNIGEAWGKENKILAIHNAFDSL